MDLEFSAEQESLRQIIRRYLDEQAPVRPYVRSMIEDPRGTSDEVWTGLARLGATGLLVPESCGGAGAGLVDMGVVLEELGRAVHPGPFLSSAVGAVSAIVATGAAADDDTTLLARLADGTVIGTIAFPLSLIVTGSTEPVPASYEKDEITGSVRLVPDACSADVFVVAASSDTGLGLYVVDRRAPGLTVTDTPTIDGTRKVGTVTLASTPGRRLGTGDALEAVRTTFDRLLVALVVDGVGTAQAVLELTVGYALQRTQFDRPIGSFQAVQHLCADMFSNLEIGRAGAYYGLWAADAAGGDELHRAATMAKAFAGDAFFRVGASAIQVHGGIGFTWEHDIHLYYKRLLTLQQALGTSAQHLEELAALVI